MAVVRANGDEHAGLKRKTLPVDLVNAFSLLNPEYLGKFMRVRLVGRPPAHRAARYVKGFARLGELIPWEAPHCHLLITYLFHLSTEDLCRRPP